MYALTQSSSLFNQQFLSIFCVVVCHFEPPILFCYVNFKIFSLSSYTLYLLFLHQNKRFQLARRRELNLFQKTKQNSSISFSQSRFLLFFNKNLLLFVLLWLFIDRRIDNICQTPKKERDPFMFPFSKYLPLDEIMNTRCDPHPRPLPGAISVAPSEPKFA